jgi:hypothetical protein
MEGIMPDRERELRALLRMGIDRKSAEKVVDGITPIEEALKGVEVQAEQTERRMQLLRDKADVGEQISEGFIVAGAAISGPLLLAMNSYIQQAGRADSTSRRWMDSMDSLNESQQRIGRVVADTLLPVLQEAADLAETAAQFAEEHPDLVKAALSIGVVMAGLGTAGVAVARMGKFVADLGEVLAGSRKMLAGQATVGTGAGAGAAGMGNTLVAAASAVVVGVIATGIVVQLVNQALEKSGMADKITAAQDEIRATGRYYPGASGFGANRQDETAPSGVRSEPDTTAQTNWETAQDAFIQFQESVTEAEEAYQERRMQIIEQYEAKIESTEQQYEERRTQIVEDYQSRRAEIEASYALQEARTLEDHRRSMVQLAQDYARQAAQAEEDYYLARTERAAQYGVQAQRAEEDHQRRLQQLRRSYERQIEDAVIGRDASAIYRARRDYDDQRSTEEESYQVQARRASEDYALQIAQMEQQFVRQQQLRATDYERRVEEMTTQFELVRDRRAEDHAAQLEQMQQQAEERLQELDSEHIEEMQQMSDQHRETLVELDQQYAREKSQRDQAFRRQLWDLEVYLGNEEQMRMAYYAQAQQDFATWWDKMNRILTTPVYVSPFVGGNSVTVQSETTISGQSSGLEDLLDARDAALEQRVYNTIERSLR